MEKKMESIKKEIRSVLISYPKGVSLNDFRRTYKDLLGVKLPTREFGFTLDIDFLHSIPDVVHIEVDKTGTPQLFALADESTQHIKKLVDKQRVVKPKTNKKSKGSFSFYKPSEVRSRVSTTRCRPFVPAVLRAEIIQIVKLYPDGIGYATFILAYQRMFQRSPNLTFLSSDPQEILQKLENAIPELVVKSSSGQPKLFFVDQNNEICTNGYAPGMKSTYQHFKANNSATSSTLNVKSHEPNGFLDVSAVSEFVKYNTNKVLKGYPEGVLAVHFPILYESFTQKTFDLHELGYNCLLDFVDALPDILVRVQSPESANDWILYHINYAANIADAAKTPVPSNDVQSRNSSRLSDLKENTMVKLAPPALQYVQSELSAEDNDQYFPVFISAFVNPSLFWFQLQTDDAIHNLNKLEKEMECFYNSQPRSEYKMKDADILIGSSCVAQFPADYHWYRCVISSLLNTENVKVFLVDYGSWETVPRSHLFYLKYNFIRLPALAFQAQLALVQPPTKVGSWENCAQTRFLELCNKSFIMAKVDSMQYQVASVFLCDTSGEEEIDINQTLVNENLAEYSMQNKFPPNGSQVATLNVINATNGSTPSNHLANSEEISSVEKCQKSSISSSHNHSINGHQTLNHVPKNHLISKFKALQVSKDRKFVRRILLGDGYHIHIIIVDKEAFVSGEELCNLLWNGKGADFLACRLGVKDSIIPTLIISKEKFPDLFSQCERYAVGGFDRTEESSVILYPLKYSIKVLNMFGHPSSKVRDALCQEIKEFNPLASVRSKSEANGEHCEATTDEDEKNLDRLCAFDLKTMKEGLVCKRLKLQAIHKGEKNESFFNQMKQIDITQSYISRRIKEIEDICFKYSEEIS